MVSHCTMTEWQNMLLNSLRTHFAWSCAENNVTEWQERITLPHWTFQLCLPRDFMGTNQVSAVCLVGEMTGNQLLMPSFSFWVTRMKVCMTVKLLAISTIHNTKNDWSKCYSNDKQNIWLHHVLVINTKDGWSMVSMCLPCLRNSMWNYTENHKQTNQYIRSSYKMT